MSEPSAPANGYTLEDVAARAGVSRATASRVINGGRRVAAPTRQAVEAAIAELGYTPNRAARSLAANRSDTVALVVSEPTGRLFSDPFFGQTILGAASVLGGTWLARRRRARSRRAPEVEPEGAAGRDRDPSGYL